MNRSSGLLISLRRGFALLAFGTTMRTDLAVHQLLFLAIPAELDASYFATVEIPDQMTTGLQPGKIVPVIAWLHCSTQFENSQILRQKGFDPNAP